MYHTTWTTNGMLYLMLCGIIGMLCIGCAAPSSSQPSPYSESAQSGIMQAPVEATGTSGSPAFIPPTTNVAPATATPTSADNASVAAAVARTNLYRQQNGCPALQESRQLDQAAYGHSEDMAVNGYFAHSSPAGVTPWTRIHATGYQFSSAAENIAAGYATADAVIDAFYNEVPPNDGHRLNILNCHLTQVGIGVYYMKGSPYGTYWTQDFATPLS